MNEVTQNPTIGYAEGKLYVQISRAFSPDILNQIVVKSLIPSSVIATTDIKDNMAILTLTQSFEKARLNLRAVEEVASIMQSWMTEIDVIVVVHKRLNGLKKDLIGTLEHIHCHEEDQNKGPASDSQSAN